MFRGPSSWWMSCGSWRAGLSERGGRDSVPGQGRLTRGALGARVTRDARSEDPACARSQLFRVRLVQVIGEMHVTRMARSRRGHALAVLKVPLAALVFAPGER